MLGRWRCALPGSEPHGIQLFRGDFNLNHFGLARLNRYSSFMIQRGLAHRLPAVSSAAAIHWLLGLHGLYASLQWCWHDHLLVARLALYLCAVR